MKSDLTIHERALEIGKQAGARLHGVSVQDARDIGEEAIRAYEAAKAAERPSVTPVGHLVGKAEQQFSQWYVKEFGAMPYRYSKEHYQSDIYRAAFQSGRYSALDDMKPVLRQAMEALGGVVSVADRKTVEFDGAKAAIAALRGLLGERE